jgi:FlaA1/EpsC-like NDP-sugar epimerase
MITDLLIVSITPYLALLIRLEGMISSPYYTVLFQCLPLMVFLRLGTFYVFRLYHRLWRYASINELLAITGAVTLSSILIIAYMFIGGVSLPLSIHIISWFLHIAFIGCSRMIIRILQNLRQKRAKSNTNVLIVGAGDAGAMIARELLHSQYCTDKKLIGFIDDAKVKTGQMLLGVKVLGTRKDICHIVKQHNVKEIIIAMPSVTGGTIREIVQECKATGCMVKTLPGIYELIDDKVTVQQLRKVEITDLLRRDPVKLDLREIAGYLSGKKVLVTGAGGSIGSELCRQVAKMLPESIVMLGKGENSIYEIHRELQCSYPKLKLTPVIADVRDVIRINHVFAECKPQVVFHAAAHKHVPLMEAQPTEAAKNNIFGTKTMAEAADRANVELFIMISTDKAVNPSSVMGATKRVAELIIRYMNRISSTKFVAVRFGNVLGSRGSVIPLFKKQIAQGGPVTVTHPEMRRYFMTIPEAVQLVLQAGAIAGGGEVFVLDMGKPVKIVDMACDLIELTGLKPHTDIQIKFTGLRPGEKLFEELLTAEEGVSASRHEKIFVANLREVEEETLLPSLSTLNNTEDEAKVIAVLEQIVPSYKIVRENCCKVQSGDLKDGTQEMQSESKPETDKKYPPAVGLSGLST